MSSNRNFFYRSPSKNSYSKIFVFCKDTCGVTRTNIMYILHHLYLSIYHRREQTFLKVMHFSLAIRVLFPPLPPPTFVIFYDKLQILGVIGVHPTSPPPMHTPIVYIIYVIHSRLAWAVVPSTFQSLTILFQSDNTLYKFSY